MDVPHPILPSIEISQELPDSGYNGNESHSDDEIAYSLLSASLSDISESHWPRDQHGRIGVFGSHLGGWLRRLGFFFTSIRADPFDEHEIYYSLLPEHSISEKAGRIALILEILRETLSCSWFNLLLIFVPIGYVSYLRDFRPTLTFLFNALAIVPLSTLLTEATERIASDAGDTIGAILNISLGNLVELILFFALKNNQIRVVQASILGSILVNLLLILGSALLVCGLPDQEFAHYAAGTQLLGSLLFVSVFTFLMPTAFDYTFKDTNGAERASLQMTRTSAVIIFCIYVIYFVHEIRHHPAHDDTISIGGDEESQPVTATPNLPISPSNMHSGSQPLPPRTIRFADEDATTQNQTLKASSRTGLDGLGHQGVENDNEDELMETRGRKGYTAARPLSVYNLNARARTHSRSLSHSSSQGRLSRDSSVLDGERAELMRPYLTARNIRRDSRLSLDRISQTSNHIPHGGNINRAISISILFITSALMSASAEFLASTIDEVTREGHISEGLIGLIIVPIVGNVAEYATVVTVAARDKMGLALAVSVGSAIQIALCVTPLTIIAAWIMDKPLVLAFNFFEIATLLGSVLLVNFLILGEGISGPLRSSGLKGGLICACYVIIG
ncbi:Vacuolar calcium ion transporter [Cladobotryum mycophilum]|uniref:Vacuolar calcium ion transporter n=1 Tax=Cladobotryum mycophilum TaxID=491253 RepID=A0ABR0S7M2_9HYPO